MNDEKKTAKISIRLEVGLMSALEKAAEGDVSQFIRRAIQNELCWRRADAARLQSLHRQINLLAEKFGAIESLIKQQINQKTH